MKTSVITRYCCEVCGGQYNTHQEALLCEGRSVQQDKGVKVGDVVLITRGEGAGSKAKVTCRMIYGKNWGHYAARRYWHSVGLVADLIGKNAWGTRQLTFDDYKPA